MKNNYHKAESTESDDFTQLRSASNGMRDAIENFASQFSWEPEIKNADNLVRYKKFVVCGMGGSALSAELLKIREPELDIIVHKNYGLPQIDKDGLKNNLIIASSYSGNTEETIDALKAALEKNMPAAVIATGGKLLEIAKEKTLPYVQIPSTGIQPRSALGFSLKALLKIMGKEEILKETGRLADLLKPADFEVAGKTLAGKIKGRVPVIYSSAQNSAVAYNWKIKFNETGKIPAFYNVFPELNHNEMAGFDVRESTGALSEKFYFIFLKDESDHPRILRRMEILEKLYRARNLPVEILEMGEKNEFKKIFSSLMLADWAAYYTAELYGLEPEQVIMVEEFKKLI